MTAIKAEPSREAAIVAERHPGPFTGADAELARACAMVTIPDYGNDDPDTHQRIMQNGIWNDHIAVQAALTAIHSIRKAATLRAPAGDGGVREALTLAVNMIMENEPGDSRAVSNEAVALAAVSVGDTSAPVMEVIRAALAPREAEPAVGPAGDGGQRVSPGSATLRERIALMLLSRRGFGFYLNPMEGGQDAYDLTLEALDEADAIITVLPGGVAQAPLTWRDGAPGNPWDKEWFIAETTYGDRVVLTALPKEWTYDFKTADETYIKADKIKRWMQFPDSQFISPEASAPGESS